MIGPVPALAPSEDVDVILQGAGLGALMGMTVAAVVRSRDPDADTWLLATSLTLLGAALGLLGVAVKRLGWW